MDENRTTKNANSISSRGKTALLLLMLVAIVAGVMLFGGKGNVPFKKQPETTVSNLPSIEDMNVEKEAVVLDNATKVVELEEDTKDEKMVSFYMEDYGRANPFLPPAESITNSMKYGFELMAPPETLSSEEVEAAKVMTTKVSGIMYNAKSSSAILNIEGSDYLVRAGDNINKYRVLAIAPDMVTVQLGNNVYKARVGEVITETLNHNTIDNLSNKFGGANK